MWRLLIICVILAGCSAGPTRTYNPFTGIEATRSGDVMADFSLFSRLTVETAVLRGGGVREFALLIAVTRSDLNYPKIDDVLTIGRTLDYVRLDERKVGRDRQEVGYVRMSQRDFAAAAAEGLPLQVVSPRGTHQTRVPARLFAAVLSGSADGP